MTEEVCSFDVETFAARHPGMPPSLAIFARAALGFHGGSPRSFRALRGDVERPASVAFAAPDARTSAGFQREPIVEYGAVVLAGLLLSVWEGKQLTRVVQRGTRVDYFVGDATGDERWVIEVGGTDGQRHAATRTAKRKQLDESLYRKPPFNKGGFVGATRFAEPSVTSLDAFPAGAP